MANFEIASVERIAGLPPAGDPHHYFAFDQAGNVWALAYNKDAECWSGVGFDGSWPTARLFRGDAVAQIATTLKSPISEIPNVSESDRSGEQERA